ncbi:MAG: hypothetical protein IJ111_05935 [Eggerthellaceae bacterium]|nr:hypothetical protein [Eggerthellaceae bacterium]
MASKLEQITNDRRFDCVEDAIDEYCLTYGDYSQLLSELLSFFGGSGDFEEKATALICSGVRSYIEETV